MKYKLMNEDIKGKSLLEVIYQNRSITKEQVERLLNADSDEYLNPFTIFNMDSLSIFEALSLLHTCLLYVCSSVEDHIP